MKRTLAALFIPAALLLASCSDSGESTLEAASTSAVASADLGRTQIVKGDTWEAEISVSDLIAREQNYYGEIKPEAQYRATVSVRSIVGATPLPSNAFSATIADGSTLTISIGGETDDIQSGDVPQGQSRTGPVTWTGKPGVEVSKIEFLVGGFLPMAAWTVSAPPVQAAPSTMPNHDEIVASETPEAVATSEVAAPVVVATPPVVVVPETTVPVVTPQAPIGFTGAPNGAPAPLSGKTVAYCMDGPSYQPGTTAFTDGTTGWTQECAG